MSKKKSDFERDVLAFQEVWSRRDKDRKAAVTARLKDLKFIQRAERDQLRQQLKGCGLSRREVDDALRELDDATHWRQRDALMYEIRSAERERVKTIQEEDARALAQVKKKKKTWTLFPPRIAQAVGDRRSVVYWNNRISRMSDAAFVEWLQESRRPLLDRSPGVPDYGDLRTFAGVEDRIIAIINSRNTTLKKQLQQVLVPITAGRHPKVFDEAALAEALAIRVRVKRRLQQAQRESPSDYTYRGAFESILSEEYSEASSSARAELVKKLATKRIKPSDAAARIAARKTGLPLSRVRVGRAEKSAIRTRPRGATVVLAKRSLEAVEHGRERGRRGRG